MDLDDEMCLCFHVTRRKIENFIRRTKPQRPSQISECFGAGTGCGWCRPFLQRLWQRSQAERAIASDDPTVATTMDDSATDKVMSEIELPSAAEYAESRTAYRKEKGL